MDKNKSGRTHAESSQNPLKHFSLHFTKIGGQPAASSTSPHMWLTDGDSLMCYIVRM